MYLLVILMVSYKGWKYYNPMDKKVIISERAEFDKRHEYDDQSLSSKEDHTSVKEDYITDYLLYRTSKKPSKEQGAASATL